MVGLSTAVAGGWSRQASALLRRWPTTCCLPQRNKMVGVLPPVRELPASIQAAADPARASGSSGARATSRTGCRRRHTSAAACGIRSGRVAIRGKGMVIQGWLIPRRGITEWRLLSSADKACGVPRLREWAAHFLAGTPDIRNDSSKVSQPTGRARVYTPAVRRWICDSLSRGLAVCVQDRNGGLHVLVPHGYEAAADSESMAYREPAVHGSNLA